MLKERRKYPRFHFTLPIKISNTAYDLVTETRDISGNGAHCFLDKEIAPMTKLKIIILVPLNKGGKKTLKKIICKGVVVRTDPCKNNGKAFYRIGIFFYEIKELDRKILLSYINSASQLIA